MEDTAKEKMDRRMCRLDNHVQGTLRHILNERKLRIHSEVRRQIITGSLLVGNIGKSTAKEIKFHFERHAFVLSNRVMQGGELF